MSERMTDERCLELVGRAVWTLDEQIEAEGEMLRARAYEVEKDAQIKALADALVNLRCVAISQGVSEAHGVVVNAGAALRLVGRL